MVETDAPEVTKVCQICGEKMNTSQMEGHLLEMHVRPLMNQAPRRMETPEPPVPDPIGDPPTDVKVPKRRGRPPKVRPEASV